MKLFNIYHFVDINKMIHEFEKVPQLVGQIFYKFNLIERVVLK